LRIYFLYLLLSRNLCILFSLMLLIDQLAWKNIQAESRRLNWRLMANNISKYTYRSKQNKIEKHFIVDRAEGKYGEILWNDVIRHPNSIHYDILYIRMYKVKSEKEITFNRASEKENLTIRRKKFVVIVITPIGYVIFFFNRNENSIQLGGLDISFWTWYCD